MSVGMSIVELEIVAMLEQMGPRTNGRSAQLAMKFKDTWRLWGEVVDEVNAMLADLPNEAAIAWQRTPGEGS